MAERASFKVLQFNIQFGQGWVEGDPDRAPVDLDRTISEIRSHDSDIVLLQEVERGWPGGVQMEPPPNYTRLRAALDGYDSFFCYPKADPRELPFGIGLAIFSKTPLTDIERLDLPSPAIEFDFKGVRTTPTDRLLIGASTAFAGRSVRVFNTHLLAFFMLKSTSETNLAQRQLVAERLKACAGPTVLGGDFNVSKHGSLVRQLGQVGYRTVQSKEITWRRRPYILDHIFYSRHLKPVCYAVKPTLASDHHALVAELAFTD